jgi:hypothetical protein
MFNNEQYTHISVAREATVYAREAAKARFYLAMDDARQTDGDERTRARRYARHALAEYMDYRRAVKWLDVVLHSLVFPPKPKKPHGKETVEELNREIDKCEAEFKTVEQELKQLEKERAWLHAVYVVKQDQLNKINT